MRAGNPNALNSLFYNHYNDLYFYGLKLVNNHNSVVDAIQDIFATLWESRKRIANVSHIKAYLFAMLRNNLIKSGKSERFIHMGTNTADWDFGFHISPEEIYLIKETELENIRRVKNLLTGLSSKQKEIVYLKFYNNYTNIEISEILSIKQQSVANLLSRTLALLRKKIMKDLHLFLNILFLFSLGCF